jgi:tetratricopeptide (TPR) repeat protein
MNSMKKAFAKVLFICCLIIVIATTVINTTAAAESVSNRPNYDQEGHDLIEQCRKAAFRYSLGDNEWAPARAKELLPLVIKRYDELRVSKETPFHDFSIELNMLNAVIKNDRSSLITCLKQNDYDLDMTKKDSELLGVEFGLEDTLALLKKYMELCGNEPLFGKQSYRYLDRGEAVAALMYAAGQKEEAKALAKQLIPLAQRKKAEESKRPSNYPYEYRTDYETILSGIISDDKNSVVYESTEKVTAPGYIKQAEVSFYTTYDSIGRSLEAAYGEVYLDKQLNRIERLPAAYRNVGLAQALAGNYDESDRAYRAALRLAENHYGKENYSFFPEIILRIKSEYAGMLKMAGRTDASAKIAEGITPEYLEQLAAKADSKWHPDELKSFSKRPIPPEWGDVLMVLVL